MACNLLRHEPEPFEQDTENELSSSESIIINMNEDTAILSDVTSDVGGIPDASDNRGSNFFCSGKLFTLVTKVTGLWNVRHKGYASLCVLFVLLNILSAAAEIIILTICGLLLERCHPPLNSNETKNILSSTDNLQSKTLSEIHNVIVCCSGFASVVTLILLIFSLHKLCKNITSFSLSAAQTRVSSKEWLLINVVLIVWVVVFVGAAGLYVYYIFSAKSLQEKGLFITGRLGDFINCTASMICVLVFEVVSCALGNLVSACFEDMKSTKDGNLNDIITIHQLLRQRLFIASDCFKVWFVVHWIVFGAICLSFLAVNTTNYSFILHLKSSSFGFFAVFFLLKVVVFVVPCVYASRITWRCNELLFKVNCARPEDWSENHPFRDRATLNEFIFYAERSQSGFTLGNFTFGSTGTLISVLVGLIGLFLSLVSFNKDD